MCLLRQLGIAGREECKASRGSLYRRGGWMSRGEVGKLFDDGGGREAYLCFLGGIEDFGGLVLTRFRGRPGQSLPVLPQRGEEERKEGGEGGR